MPGTSLDDLLQVLVEIRDELRLFRSQGAASDGDARWFDIEAAASYHRPTDLGRENRQSSHIAEGAAAREILVLARSESDAVIVVVRGPRSAWLGSVESGGA